MRRSHRRRQSLSQGPGAKWWQFIPKVSSRAWLVSTTTGPVPKTVIADRGGKLKREKLIRGTNKCGRER